MNRASLIKAMLTITVLIIPMISGCIDPSSEKNSNNNDTPSPCEPTPSNLYRQSTIERTWEMTTPSTVMECNNGGEIPFQYNKTITFDYISTSERAALIQNGRSSYPRIGENIRVNGNKYSTVTENGYISLLFTGITTVNDIAYHYSTSIAGFMNNTSGCGTVTRSLANNEYDIHCGVTTSYSMR